jgi:hypothetical protein
VNSGRLSVPAFLVHSALNTPDVDAFEGDMVPGAPMDDAPVRGGGADAWLLDQLGNRFVLLAFVDDPGQLAGRRCVPRPRRWPPARFRSRRCWSHRMGAPPAALP